MKSFFTIITVLVFVLIPTMLFAQNYQASEGGPPIEQPLVREGTLAVRLVDVLKLGTTTDEAQAESLLTSAGIAPRNGWIADYPVTPDIANELRQAVDEAATTGTLTIGNSEALMAFDATMREYNLTLEADASGPTANDQPENTYPDDTVINNYYYDEGPPVVTYYAPPYDYAYLYSWVPYPFWWWGFWFPGFFVLADFDRVVVANGAFAVVSNHFFNPANRTFVTVDPVTRVSATSLVRSNTVIGPSALHNSTAFRSNWASAKTGGSTFTHSRAMSPSSSGMFTRQSTGSRSFTAPSRNGTFRQGATGVRSFSAPSGGRMSAPSFTHNSFGRSFGGTRSNFGGR